ncbi:hypothetical protein [Haloarcula sp. JP-L23]
MALVALVAAALLAVRRDN